jgi:hypothetical protein
MLSVVSKYSRLAADVFRTSKNIGFVSVSTRRNMSLYYFDDEVKISAPVLYNKNRREVSQIDTTDIERIMVKEADDFGDDAEEMGSNGYDGFRAVNLTNFSCDH